jgi:hypothetical protein
VTPNYKLANLVQETLFAIYQKAKTNKVNKIFIEVSSLKDICYKMNAIIEYLESNPPRQTYASHPAGTSPSKSKPNNAVFKAINDFCTNI